MSIDKLEEQKEELLGKIETLEKGCEKCETYTEIESLSAKVEEVENKIEELLGEDEDED